MLKREDCLLNLGELWSLEMLQVCVGGLPADDETSLYLEFK